MILSMTGFGEAQQEEAGHSYHLEIRAVNNRYFKASIRLPDSYAFLEADVERLLRQRLTRGSVNVHLYVRDLSAAAAGQINTQAVHEYLEQLRPFRSPDTTIDLAALLALPGVVQTRELTDVEREHVWSIVSRLTTQALDRLMEMRAVEGRALAADLRSHCERIRTHLDAIGARTPGVVDEYRKRLMDRINELIASSNVRLAEEDLIREVAIYAERSDISEEITRLGAHLKQFDGYISASEPTGRTLDFLTQEMLREANTIGSKAGDAEIARRIIEIKSAIDRLKEQVQNVE